MCQRRGDLEFGTGKMRVFLVVQQNGDAVGIGGTLREGEVRRSQEVGEREPADLQWQRLEGIGSRLETYARERGIDSSADGRRAHTQA